MSRACGLGLSGRGTRSVFESREQVKKRFHDFLGRLDFDLVRPHPGLVAAEFMMARSREIAVGAVGQLDGKARLERALCSISSPLSVNTSKGIGGDPEVAQAEGLQEHLDFGRRVVQQQDAIGVGLFMRAARLGVGRLGKHLEGIIPLRLGRFPNTQGELTLGRAKFDPIAELDRLVGLKTASATSSATSRIFWYRAFDGPFAEVDVVDVATGPVGHDSHEGGFKSVGLEKLLHAVGEDGEVVARNMADRNAPDVVERVVREQRDRPAVAGRAERNARPGVGRAGRFQQGRAPLGGFILTLSTPPNGFGFGVPGFKCQAPVEDLGGYVNGPQPI